MVFYYSFDCVSLMTSDVEHLLMCFDVFISHLYIFLVEVSLSPLPVLNQIVY
jgi:hypothetical protein